MINSQLLIIHKKPVLFNILNEIKSNLNFKIILVDDDNIDIKSKLENFVIISDSEKLYSKGLLKIENYPINIQKLVEIINIQFLKNKFQQQNNIKVGKYEINLNSRKMSYKNKFVSLTEKETMIISFLNLSNKEITVQNLQSEVWGHKSKLETHTVETHVYRLRKKVEKKFNDKSFILSLKNGYKI
ncbi:winged helix-turn-helix domain-containing protein [Candidatus Pelagibacter sp.]|nr:winged helix-turn-helix domain-containing protein [Candidatus Pelagibacter sp.]